MSAEQALALIELHCLEALRFEPECAGLAEAVLGIVALARPP